MAIYPELFLYTCICKHKFCVFQGKFTFKNGRIYEGMFERDHIVEYPEFTMDGTTSPDLTNIRTRTPLPMGKN